MPLVALVVDCGNGLVVVVNILCCFPLKSFSVTDVVVVVVVVGGGGSVENENGFIGWLPGKIKRGVMNFFSAKQNVWVRLIKQVQVKHLVFSAFMGIP